MKQLYTIISVCLIFFFGNLNAYNIDTTYTVYQTFIKLHKNYPDIKIVYPQKSDKITATENIVYNTINNRDLHLDIYRPAIRGILPAIIMIHGGGWRSGNKVMERPMAQRLAENGYVAITVEYRLSLEARFPAAVCDIKNAIRFIKDNAEKYGVDTSKIAIEGESAGGHLAMLTAMSGDLALFGADNHSKSCSKVQAAIDVDGILSFLMPASLSMDKKPDSPDAYWLGGIYSDNPLAWKDASPLSYVGKNSVPSLFICSSIPRYHAGRDEMIDMLSENGIYSEKYTFVNCPHSFWLFDPWFEKTANYIISFLNKVLK